MISRKFSLAVAAFSLYWLVIFAGTHTPRSVGIPLHNGDKLLHFTAYCGLAWLLSWVVQWNSGTALRRYLVVVVLIAAYGVLDELTQLLVPGRNAEFWDWAADVVGCICGIGLHRLTIIFLSGADLRNRLPEPAASRDES